MNTYKRTLSNVIKIPLFILFFYLSACSQWQLHAPIAKVEENHNKYGLWQVICEAAEQSLINKNQKEKWVWATNSQGKVINLKGKYEDGFLLIDSNTGPSLQNLQQNCVETLAQKSTDKTWLKLVRVRAARTKEKIHVPIVFNNNKPQSIERLVIFGDSLSDTGKLKQRMMIFPGEPYWLGRFSNGPVWVDYLEGLEKFAIQNHAYGGAFTTKHEPVPEESILDRIRAGAQLFISGSVELQVDDFIKNSLKQETLQEPEGTLIIIWAGANDYIFKEPLSGVIETFLNSPETASGYKNIVNKTIDSLRSIIIKLHEKGATKFLLPSMPDIGKSPIPLQNTTYMSLKTASFDNAHKIALSQRLSDLTNYHNKQLEIMVNQLNTRLAEIEIIVSDSNKNIASIHKSEAVEKTTEQEGSFDYGFTLADNQEILSEGDTEIALQKRCYIGGYLGSSNKADICQDQGTAFFWDVAHPTSYTHCWQAYMLVNDMSRAGWAKKLPEQSDYKQWCDEVYQKIQPRKSGHSIFF